MQHCAVVRRLDKEENINKSHKMNVLLELHLRIRISNSVDIKLEAIAQCAV